MSEEAVRQWSEYDDCNVSLRIRHPSIDPDEITRELGLKPEHAWACGEPRRSESGTPLGGKRRDSYWTARLPGAAAGQAAAQSGGAAVAEVSGSFAQLQMHLQVVTQIRRNRAFLERLIAEGGEAAFVVEVPSAAGTSFRVDPALMRQLGSLGLRLEFEFV